MNGFSFSIDIQFMILYGLCIEHLQHHLKISFIFANVWLMSCCFSIVVFYFICFLIHKFYYKLVVIQRACLKYDQVLLSH
jgi:hypothetical protein